MLNSVSKDLLIIKLSDRRDKHLAELRSQNVDSMILDSWTKSYEKLLKKHSSSVA